MESVAIVTGGAQGIGAAICKALLDKGCKVCVADIQEVKGKHFVEELQEKHGKDKVIFCHCDVSKEEHYKRVFDSTLKVFGTIDILINNAGIMCEQDPRVVLDVNLMGPIIGCQTAFKYMGKSSGGKGGIVINTASILGFVPAYFLPSYTATKHGVIGLTRSYGLPYHFEKEGLIFAAICPSYTNTDLMRSTGTNGAVPGLDFTQHPELQSPEDIATGVLKILEERINGSVLLISKRSGLEYIGYQEIFKDVSI